METNKIVLITGGSRGLGRDMALAAADKGLDVIFTYHSKKQEAEKVQELIRTKGRKAAIFQLDTGDVTAFENFAQELKNVLSRDFGTDHFDFLVNNAGIGLDASFAETTEEQFDLMYNIHFKGVFFLTQKMLPLMNDGGGIINISTGLARFSLPGRAAYASMKGGIETLTRYLAKELGPRGIRANTVAPGAIATDFSGGHVRDDERVNKFVAGVTALGRAGLPEDIGGVVAFLCTPEARWINAQRIEVSGGMFI